MSFEATFYKKNDFIFLSLKNIVNWLLQSDHILYFTSQ